MTDQLSLTGFDPPPPPTDRLFLALLPDAAAGVSIGRTTARLRADHALSAAPVPADRLHVTLFHVGDFAGIPPGLLDAVRTAVSRAADTPPFDVSFDHAISFSGPPGRKPLVLRGGDEALAPLVAFQKSLVDALARVGITRKERAYTPHVTLLYDDRMVARQPLDPVHWTVRDVVLVNSHIGKGRYDTLARWPLGGHAP